MRISILFAPVKTLLLAAMFLTQQPAQDVQFGVITGQLHAVDGKPAAGIRISAMGADDLASQSTDPAFEYRASIAETDSSGHYRLEKLPPGRYYIVAGLIDAPTYHPGTSSTEGATLVTVSAGSALAGFDFALTRSSGVTINGRVVPPPSPAVAALNILEIGLMGQASTRLSAVSAEAPVNADGSFELHKVMPGNYFALVTTIRGSYSTPVVVTDQDFLADVEVAMPRVVTGRIVIEGKDRVSTSSRISIFDSLRIEARSIERTAPAITTTAQAAGPFYFSSILGEGDDEYRVHLTGLPFGYYGMVSYVAAGSPKPTLKIDPVTDPPEILVAITTTPPDDAPQGVTVTGRLTSLDQHLPDGIVVRMTGATAADAHGETPVRPDGTFEFHGVPPGSYITRAAAPALAIDPLATRSVVVADRDLDHVDVPLVIQVPVSGRIAVADKSGHTMPRLQFAPLVTLKNGDTSIHAAVLPDGTFSFRLHPGTYAVTLDGLPPTFLVKSIESDSTNLLKAPLKVDTTTTEISLQALLATSIGVRVRGSVITSNPANAYQTEVLLNSNTDAQSFRALVDADGAFEFFAIPPGSYRLLDSTGDAITSGLLIGDRDLDGIPLMSAEATPSLMSIHYGGAGGAVVSEDEGKSPVGIDVSGHVSFVDAHKERSIGAPPIPPGVFIGFESSEAGVFAAMQTDGSFKAILPEGRYRVFGVFGVFGNGMERRYVVQSMVSGATDLLKDGLEVLGNMPGAPIEVTLEYAQ